MPRQDVTRRSRILAAPSSGRRRHRRGSTAPTDQLRRSTSRPPGVADANRPALPPTNLPPTVMSFVGRERDLAAAELILALPPPLALTLTGTGGSGKTRLALEIGRRLLPTFPDGVWWVHLHPISDAALVTPIVANTLGIAEPRDGSMLDALLAHLRDKRLLLVLDNAEHLVAECAALAQTLLRDCPTLCLLVTSRQALGIPGERLWPVLPLAVPDSRRLALVGEKAVRALLEYPGVQLFVERAHAVRPSFALTPDNAAAVTRICCELEGLPLAIELAAARIKVLPPQEIQDWLGSALQLLADNHQTSLSHYCTLNAAIDWSFQLLTESERALLMRLAIFASPVSFGTIHVVCGGPGQTPAEMLDWMTKLVDKSLVIVDETDNIATYRLLNLIRQYVLIKFEVAGDGAGLRRRHAEFYASLAESMTNSTPGSDQTVTLRRLEREHDNLRSALTWTLAEADVALALRLAGALWPFWEAQGHIAEGRRWLDRVLDLADDAPGPLRVHALDGAAALAHAQSDYSRAVALHEESLALKRALDDQSGAAFSLLHLGMLAKDLGDNAQAGALYAQSLEVFRVLRDRPHVAHVLLNMGILAHVQGNYRESTARFDEAVGLFRALGDRRGLASALSNRGLVARNRGDYDGSLTFHQQALALRQELSDEVGIAFSLTNLGTLAQDQADFDAALGLQEQALARFRALGHRWGTALLLNTLAVVALYRHEYERASQRCCEGLAIYLELEAGWGQAMSLTTLAYLDLHRGDRQQAVTRAREALAIRHAINDQHGIAESLEALAAIEVAEGCPGRAACLAAAAEAIREAIDAPRSPAEQADLGAWLAGLNEPRLATRLAEAYARGRAMTPGDAVAYARADLDLDDVAGMGNQAASPEATVGPAESDQRGQAGHAATLAVRHALRHLDDLALLNHCDLGLWLAPPAAPALTGRQVRALLLATIDNLTASADSSTHRLVALRQRVLHSRFVDRREVADVCQELALSERQYYRELKLGVEMVSETLFRAGQPGRILAETPL